MMNAVGQTDTILVLGGGSAIGVAIAWELARVGTRRIVLAGPREDSLQAAVMSLEDVHAEVITRAFDAADTGSHAGFFESVSDAYGDLDVIVIAFGVLPDQAKAEADPSVAVRAAMVNYVGALSCLLHAGNVMRTQGHGTIVVLSSVAGQRARRSNFVYGSSKAGIDAAAEGLGYALEGSGAHILTVRPGFVRSKMTDGLEEAPMAVTPADVARATVEGIRKHRSVIWVPSQIKLLASGMRLLPRGAMKRVKA